MQYYMSVPYQPYLPKMRPPLRHPACRLIFFGWPLFLGHVASALVQIPTIIGIPTAVTQLQMAKFALWPFGQGDSCAGSTACLSTTCFDRL